MGSMNTTRGSLNYLFPIPTGLAVKSGQTISYYANVAAGAGVFLGSGKIITSLHGWIYPEDEFAVNSLPFDPRKLHRYYRSARAQQRRAEKKAKDIRGEQ
jgi:hypothetical protein